MLGVSAHWQKVPCLAELRMSSAGCCFFVCMRVWWMHLVNCFLCVAPMTTFLDSHCPNVCVLYDFLLSSFLYLFLFFSIHKKSYRNKIKNTLFRVCFILWLSFFIYFFLLLFLSFFWKKSYQCDKDFHPPQSPKICNFFHILFQLQKVSRLKVVSRSLQWWQMIP